MPVTIDPLEVVRVTFCKCMVRWQGRNSALTLARFQHEFSSGLFRNQKSVGKQYNLIVGPDQSRDLDVAAYRMEFLACSFNFSLSRENVFGRSLAQADDPFTTK